MILEFANLLLGIFAKTGYTGIIVLMTIESSFIPFPSEVVIPPAAYLAQQGQLNIFGVIASGILGSLFGAVINYILALTLGRKIIYALAGTKWANILLVDEKKIARAENYFLRYGGVSTFLGRLVPAVRQLISIPAGFSGMKIKRFLFFTFLGSGVWTVILAVLGYFLGANQELLAEYYKEISLATMGIVFAIIAFFVIKKMAKKSPRDDGSLSSGNF